MKFEQTRHALDTELTHMNLLLFFNFNVEIFYAIIAPSKLLCWKVVKFISKMS